MPWISENVWDKGTRSLLAIILSNTTVCTFKSCIQEGKGTNSKPKNSLWSLCLHCTWQLLRAVHCMYCSLATLCLPRQPMWEGLAACWPASPVHPCKLPPPFWLVDGVPQGYRGTCQQLAAFTGNEDDSKMKGRSPFWTLSHNPHASTSHLVWTTVRWCGSPGCTLLSWMDLPAVSYWL